MILLVSACIYKRVNVQTLYFRIFNIKTRLTIFEIQYRL